jgi:hypothetical protein
MADEIITELKKWARSFCQQEDREYLKGEFHLPIWDEIPPIKIDLYIPAPKADIFIELENSMGNIDGNVVKYWPWMERKWKPDYKLFLIHVLNPYQFGTNQSGDRNYQSRIEIAKFFANKMEKEYPLFKYVPIDDLQRGDDWKQEAIKRCKEKIKEICSK